MQTFQYLKEAYNKDGDKLFCRPVAISQGGSKLKKTDFNYI